MSFGQVRAMGLTPICADPIARLNHVAFVGQVVIQKDAGRFSKAHQRISDEDKHRHLGADRL